MLGRSAELLSLLWPVVLGTVSAIIAAFPMTIFERTGVLKLSFFEFFSLEHGIHKGFIRYFFIIISGVLFLFPAFRDYSGFFPERMKIAVFFDNAGIEEFLSTLPADDRRKLRIPSSWKEQKSAFFSRLNSDLSEAGIPFWFSENVGETHAQGDVTFKVRQTEQWGVQLYRIVDAHGSLTHSSEAPGKDRSDIVSQFDLMETEGATVKGSLRDVYLNHGLLILPEFRQLFRTTPTKQIFYNSLVAATRVDIFPYIDVSKTLYLVRVGDGEVPIGYGEYSIP